MKKPFERSFRQKRVSAFLTTSLALFCLCCFVASASIQQFATSTDLKLTSDIQDTHSFVRSVVEQQTTDEQLSKFVTAAANQVELVANTDIATHNLAVIRDSLDVQLARQPDSSEYVVSIHYRGYGTDCERYLTANFAEQLANRLDSRIVTSDAKASLSRLIAEFEQRLAGFTNLQYEDLEMAESQLIQINAELSNVHRAIQQLRPQVQPNQSGTVDLQKIFASINTLDQIRSAITQIGQPGIQVDREGIGVALKQMRGQLVDLQGKMVASAKENSGPIRVVNTSLVSHSSDTQPILNSLEQIDTDSLESGLAEMQESIRSQAVQLRAGLVELKQANNSLFDGKLTVDSVSPLKTQPIESAPGLAHLMLFGFLSIFIGTCVAMVYQPALDGVGFDSIDDASQQLGIPVVAKLHHDSPSLSPKPLEIASTIVRVSEVVLFAFLLLIILLCLAQPEIREAMLTNPFYGLSRISAMFFG